MDESDIEITKNSNSTSLTATNAKVCNALHLSLIRSQVEENLEKN